MIVEQATVVEVDQETLLVETIQQSSCGSCTAQKGCGQGVLAKYLSSSSYFRIQRDSEDRRSFNPGDIVELGIDELAIVRGAMWLYLVPIGTMLVGAYMGHMESEFWSIVFAIAGLIVGGYLSSRHAKKVRNHPEYAPILVPDRQDVRIVQPGHPS